MKTLKLLFFNPQYLIVFVAIGILFIIDAVLNLIVTPFIILMEGLERLIKLLLNLIH